MAATALTTFRRMRSFCRAPQAVLFAPGQIVARVGDKSILYCDVAPIVNMRLGPLLAKAKGPAERQAMEAAYRDPG